MLLDRSKEELIRELTEQAAKAYGPERAAALGMEIDKAAGWLVMVGSEPIDPRGEEPDYMFAPAEGEVSR
jgi:hypothetical protein